MLLLSLSTRLAFNLDLLLPARLDVDDEGFFLEFNLLVAMGLSFSLLSLRLISALLLLLSGSFFKFLDTFFDMVELFPLINRFLDIGANGVNSLASALDIAGLSDQSGFFLEALALTFNPG